MKTTFRFDGGTDLVLALAQLPQRASRRLQREALVEAAEPMRKQMGKLAPRRPPHPDMADNIVIGNATGEDSREVAIAVGPAKRFFHGSFQELGTAHHAAQPFARPAFDGTAPAALGVIGAALWRELAGRGINRPSSSGAGPVSGGPGGGLL